MRPAVGELDHRVATPRLRQWLFGNDPSLDTSAISERKLPDDVAADDCGRAPKDSIIGPRSEVAKSGVIESRFRRRERPRLTCDGQVHRRTWQTGLKNVRPDRRVRSGDLLQEVNEETGHRSGTRPMLHACLEVARELPAQSFGERQCRVPERLLGWKQLAFRAKFDTACAIRDLKERRDNGRTGFDVYPPNANELVRQICRGVFATERAERRARLGRDGC
jgi:hypothetical protein